jgi:hypothetical protein
MGLLNNPSPLIVEVPQAKFTFGLHQFNFGLRKAVQIILSRADSFLPQWRPAGRLARRCRVRRNRFMSVRLEGFADATYYFCGISATAPGGQQHSWLTLCAVFPSRAQACPVAGER